MLPVEAAGPTEVDPAAAGPVPVLPVEAAGGLLGLRAGGWAGAGGQELGAGLGAGERGWGPALGAGGPGPGGRGGGWGWGTGAGAGGWDGDWGAKISPLHVSVYTKHVHVLQLLHELFHLLLAVREPPAQLPVQAAMPVEADPATLAGPVPLLLPVEALGQPK